MRQWLVDRLLLAAMWLEWPRGRQQVIERHAYEGGRQYQYIVLHTGPARLNTDFAVDREGHTTNVKGQ